VTTPNPMLSFNDALIADFRAHGGHASSGPFVGRKILLLTTTGAKSGESRTAPLAYSQDGDHLIVIASKGGAPTHPAWYLNLLAHPVVTVEVGDEVFQARASVAHGDERRRLYDAHAELMPTFAEYEKKTTRQIPVVVLERLGR
jgi:deazaflavin-dependent oxidoreductase (nitroreductase family)